VFACLYSPCLTSGWSFKVSSIASTPSVLSYKSQTRLVVTLKQPLRGQFADRLEISFENTTLRQRFVIARHIKAIVGNRAEYELLRPRAPYVAQHRAPREPESDVVAGPPPPATSTVAWVVKLTKAPIPTTLAAILSSGSVRDNLEELRRTVLPAVLDCDTYGSYWKTVIWIEEQRMECVCFCLRLRTAEFSAQI
jgi:helicase MOV-10